MKRLARTQTQTLTPASNPSEEMGDVLDVAKTAVMAALVRELEAEE